MNIADAIAFQAQLRPHAPAIIQDTLVLSFRNLDRAIWRAAGALRAEGVAAGDIVGIAMGNVALHLVAVLALARIGAVSVGIRPRMPEVRRKALAEKFRPLALVAFKPEHGVVGVRQIQADPEWLAPAAALPERFEPFEGRGKPWRLTLTSGTTGIPKGIPYLHDRTLLQMRLEQAVIELRSDARFLCSTDLNVNAGLGPCMRHMFAGNAVVMLNDWSPAKFLSAIDRHGVTHAFTTPGLLATLAPQLTDNDLRCPDLVYLAVAGGKLPLQLRDLVLARLTPNLYPSYGMSEAGGVAMADPRTAARVPDSVGRVMSWTELQIVDERDQPVPPGTPGSLRLRGPTVFDGYYEDPEANARSFRDGWFYPGDQGRLSATGLLFIGGRSDEVANIGGQKTDLAALDEAIGGHPEVAEAAAFVAKPGAGPERIYAAVVARGVLDPKVLLQHCRDKLGLRMLHDIHLVPQLPRNATGKVQRHELVHMLSKGPRAAGTDATKVKR